MAGRELATFGPSGTGRVARLLGLPGGRIRIVSLVAALLRSPFGR